MIDHAEAAHAEIDDFDRRACLAAIDAAWAQSMTPPDLRDACFAFSSGEETRKRVDHLRAALLLTLGVWIGDLVEEQGHDRRMLEQVAAAEAQRCVAMLMRAACERDGRPYVPARQAIVAYFHAEGVAKSEPFKCDIQGAVAAYLAGAEEQSGEAT